MSMYQVYFLISCRNFYVNISGWASIHVIYSHVFLFLYSTVLICLSCSPPFLFTRVLVSFQCWIIPVCSLPCSAVSIPLPPRFPKVSLRWLCGRGRMGCWEGCAVDPGSPLAQQLLSSLEHSSATGSHCPLSILVNGQHHFCLLLSTSQRGERCSLASCW